ncbi:MAG: M48 family peptidase [Nitrospinae bacterium]|nr:M48 family peptidase [Nitrospinota bacterium]
MIRIQGIVRLANTVRQNLQNGIPSGEARAFQDLVRQNVRLIEDLCQQARTTPRALPSPSRQAYLFLKNLDLDHLPLHQDVEAPLPAKRIRISNIVKGYKVLLEWISAAASNPASAPTEGKRIAQRLWGEVETIERLCADSHGSPQDLEEPSRRAYGWMKFLTLEDHLERHLDAVSRGAEIFQRVGSGCRLGPRKPLFQLAHLTRIYRRKTYRDALVVQASEGFLDAGDEVLEAIARCALLGKDRRWLQRIEEYVDSEAYGDILFEVETAAGLNGLEGQGRHYGLGALFEKVNTEQFRGKMQRPGLTWSRSFTFRKFGHYHPARDQVMLSLTLDDPRVPPFVVEFVLYHELLHKKLGVERRGSTRRAHTDEFRREERKFPRFEEAEAWLARLATDLRTGKNPWRS